MIERSNVETALARVVELIDSRELRYQVVDAWMLAVEQGHWQSVNDLLAIPFTLLADARGVSLIEHTVAVTLGAIGLAHAQMDAYNQMPYAVDIDRLVAGGILHDVGKLVEIERRPDGTFAKSRAGKLTRHPVLGAIIAAKAGLPAEIVNIVACHAKEGDGVPQVVETVLIHQADFAAFEPLAMLGKDALIV